MKSDEVFLRHILDELDFLLKRTGGIDRRSYRPSSAFSTSDSAIIIVIVSTGEVENPAFS